MDAKIVNEHLKPRAGDIMVFDGTRFYLLLTPQKIKDMYCEMGRTIVVEDKLVGIGLNCEVFARNICAFVDDPCVQLFSQNKYELKLVAKE